ncbi:hypothetical protein TNIN_452481 [Trichonephila inaurata madagascariensis]|uniref:Uncharacterized protein n=1 Tax=Trichonephila inaurata madagascariensis TaxID=2747483 RepID=A0A8X6K2E4_9ARAC|nr:hypothetical protein TNIN_452481 [Trichonephila inaurata madagascariensis]
MAVTSHHVTGSRVFLGARFVPKPNLAFCVIPVSYHPFHLQSHITLIREAVIGLFYFGATKNSSLFATFSSYEVAY